MVRVRIRIRVRVRVGVTVRIRVRDCRMNTWIVSTALLDSVRVGGTVGAGGRPIVSGLGLGLWL